MSAMLYNLHMENNQTKSGQMEREPKFRGDRLQALMDRRGLTLGQLEYLCGVSTPMLSHMARSTRPGVSAINVAKVAAGLGTSIEYLMNLSDDSRPMERVEGNVREDDGVYTVLNDEEQAVVDALMDLDDSQRLLVMQLIDSLRRKT